MLPTHVFSSDRVLGFALLYAVGLAHGDSIAEEPAPDTPARVIEEIVVTAQKREESLREVPISMSVFDDRFLTEQRVTDFRELSKFAGNVRLVIDSSAGDTISGTANIRIRGFGTAGGGDLFEQPVGVAIDGDSYSKLSPFLGGLFDVERIEILKGPQGTLFGKNTTAGLINLTTARPTDELAGFVDFRIGEYESRRFEGAVGGPVIADFLNVRVAGLADERDGWIRNTLVPRFDSDPILGGRDRKGIRVNADFPSLFGVELRLSEELTSAETVGGAVEGFRTDDDPTPVNYFRKYDPDYEFELGNGLGSTDGPNSSDTDTLRFVANLGYELTDWDFDATIGYSRFEHHIFTDGERVPAPTTYLAGDSEGPQTTFEIRAASPTFHGFLGLGEIFGVDLGETDFHLGFYHQRRSFDFVQPYLGEALLIAEFGAVFSTGFFPPAPPGSGQGRNPAFEVDRIPSFFEEARSYAGFGQLAWRPRERWTLEVGGRFTQESREGEWDIVANSPFGERFWTTLGFGFFQTAKERSESGFTPRVSLAYDWTDDVNLFVSRSTGFKSGGFNANATDPSPEFLEFDTERATAYEIGTKSRLLDGAMSVDFTLFWQTFEDLQTLVLDQETLPDGTALPIGTYVVENAGEAHSRGFELDSTWLATEWLTFRGAAGLADTEYVSFPLGTCEPSKQNTDGDEFTQCNLSGRGFEYTPRWTATLTPSVRVPLASLVSAKFLSTVDVFGSFTAEYQDVHDIGRSLDPIHRQPWFFRFHATLGFGDLEHGWSASLGVENLTDEYVGVNGFSTIPHAAVRYPAPPRIISGGVRLDF